MAKLFGPAGRFLIAMLATMLAFRIYLFLTAGTFWFDEAMLAVSISGASYHDLFRILPYYDQAAPLGYLLLVKPLSALIGKDWAFRLPSLIAGIAAMLVPLKYSFLPRKERIYSALVIAGSIIAIHYSTEAKQYSAELLVSALLPIAFHGFVFASDDRELRHIALGLVIFLAAILFVSSFPIIYCGGLFALILSERSHRTRKTFVLLYLAVGFIYATYYFVWVRGAYAAQIGNYGYSINGFAASPTRWLPFAILQTARTFFQYFGIASWLFILPILEGIRIGVTRRLPMPLCLLGVVLAAWALNLIGLFPLMPGRQMLFALPFVAITMALGISSIEDHVSAPGYVASACAAIMGIEGLLLTTIPRFETAPITLAYLARHRDTPVMLTWGSQPIYQHYFSQRFPPGCIGHNPMVLGLTDRCSHTHAAWSDSVDAQYATWYQLTIIDNYEDGGDLRHLTSAQVLRLEDSYLDWLVNTAEQQGSLLVFTVQLPNRFVTKLLTALRAHGDVSIVLDERNRRDYGALLARFRVRSKGVALR